jgi:hypothetical protein
VRDDRLCRSDDAGAEALCGAAPANARLSKAALAVTPGRKVIDGQVKAGQLAQRAGEDGGALSASARGA